MIPWSTSPRLRKHGSMFSDPQYNCPWIATGRGRLYEHKDCRYFVKIRNSLARRLPQQPWSLLTSQSGRVSKQARGGRGRGRWASIKKKLCAISRAFHLGKKVRLLANKTLNIYVVHQYTAISYSIFSMFTSSANKVWCVNIITHHYTRWAKNNYLEVKLAVYHLRMLHLWNSDLFMRSVHTVPQVQLCTSTFFSAKWPNFNLLHLSISVTMGCHSSWQDACLLYQGARSNLIQEVFITKPQDPDQRVVMAVLRQKVDQL